MRRRDSTLFAAFLALATLAPSASWAQARRWSFDAELGAGTMIHDFDHDSLDASTPTFGASARIGFRVIGPLAVQASGAFGRFFRDRRALPFVAGTLGVRFEPRIGSLGRAWVDANAGVYLPGTATDVGLDVGAGFAFDVLPVLSVGPFARFSHVFDGREGRATLWLPYERQASQDTDDIHWWTAGIALSVHLAPKPPRERVAGHEQRDDDGATPTDGASQESTDASTPGCPVPPRPTTATPPPATAPPAASPQPVTTRPAATQPEQQPPAAASTAPR